MSAKKRRLEHLQDDTDRIHRKKIKLAVSESPSPPTSPSSDATEADSSCNSPSPPTSPSLSNYMSLPCERLNRLYDDHEEEMELLHDDQKNIIDSARKIFESKMYSESQLFAFCEILKEEASHVMDKITELKERESALETYLECFKSLKSGRFPRFVSHSDDSDKKYFNEKVLNFSKKMLKGLRYKQKWQSEDDNNYNDYIESYTNYSVDFALKSKEIHPQYIKGIHRLLKSHVSGVSGLTRIIAEYANNGHRWYRMQITEPTNNDADPWTYHSRNDDSGILYEVNDVFTDNTHYAANPPSILDGKLVNFESWRQTLGIETEEMSDHDLACFVIAVGMNVFGFDDLDDSEDWIVEHHAHAKEDDDGFSSSSK